MKISVNNLCNTIWELEVKYDLFNQKRFGVPFWNMVRMRVYYSLAKRLGVFGEPHPFKRGFRWKISFLIGVVLGSFKNLMRIFDLISADVIVFEHIRTKKIDQNLFADVYSHYYALDKIKEKKKVLVFARTQNGFFEKNDNLKRFNIDSIELLRFIIGIVFSKLGLFTPKITKALLRDINEEFNMDCSRQVAPLLRKGVIEYFVSYCLYRLLFVFTFKVREIILVDSYSSRAGIIAAAKDSGIKVSELQHGVITKYHLGYSYPEGSPNIRFIPDSLFVWSDFWRENLFNIWPTQLDTYSNKYFDKKISDYAHVERQDNAIVIISQGAISSQLADQILLNLNKFINYKVYYKLHPSEYGNWQNNQSLVEISKNKNFKLVEDVDLFELFSKCKYQVGVFSTALFEGIEFGCKLILVDLPGSEYMSCLKEKIYLHEFT
mgnify:CR=1 FL=1